MRIDEYLNLWSTCGFCPPTGSTQPEIHTCQPETGNTTFWLVCCPVAVNVDVTPTNLQVRGVTAVYGKLYCLYIMLLAIYRHSCYI